MTWCLPADGLSWACCLRPAASSWTCSVGISACCLGPAMLLLLLSPWALALDHQNDMQWDAAGSWRWLSSLYVILASSYLSYQHFLFPDTLIYNSWRPPLPHLPNWFRFLINWSDQHFLISHWVYIYQRISSHSDNWNKTIAYVHKTDKEETTVGNRS